MLFCNASAMLLLHDVFYFNQKHLQTLKFSCNDGDQTLLLLESIILATPFVNQRIYVRA